MAPALAVSLAVSLSGCGEAARERAERERFEALHRRIYDVYQLAADRDAVWALLAQSFAGEALTEEYVEHYTTLARMTRERTSIRVLAVDYENVAFERRGTSNWVIADWSVGGIVTHQGHQHPRVNRYRAGYALADVPGVGPRIVDTELIRLERVQSADLGAFPLDALPQSGQGFLSLTDLVREGVVEVGIETPPAARSE